MDINYSMRKNMNQRYELAKNSTAANSVNQTAEIHSKTLTMSGIDDQLGGHIGQPDMGLISNYKANRHVNNLKFEAFKKITTEKYNALGELSIQALKGQAELIREQLKIEWNHQYSALAEKAAVGEMTVIRKLEAVLDAGRELLYGDRADALDRLDQRYEEGFLTDDDYARELNYLFGRYSKLLNEFESIVDQRGESVRQSFRSK